MIIEAIINLTFKSIIAVLDWLPSIQLPIPDSLIFNIQSVLNGVGYFIPLPVVMPIIGIFIAWNGFKIVWALICRIKSFLPTMGN